MSQEIIILSPDQLKDMLLEAAETASIKAISRYKEATKEYPMPPERIMEAKGWADRKTFYKKRRECGAQPVDRISNVDLFLLSDFNQSKNPSVGR